jgi:hypothetical protein
MNPGDFTFAGIENVVSSGIVTLVSAISVVGLLLELILMIALGWNYFKLLLEVVERYIVVGVLCYTAPLAFCLGGSKATNKVFQSWCRMVGSQLLLLVLNVWFIRGFNSSVGQFVANGGALTNGQGNIFLWLFCSLAFLKTAQKFDSYLASLGLSVAQTGSSMGMELMMGMRMLSGLTGDGAKSAGNVFKGGSGTASGATGTAAAGGFMAGLASKFKGNSYVRDAVVDGGSKIGVGGSVGLVARAFGGMAAKNGAELTGASIASVASRPANASGTIAGEIADRSLKNYMPHLSGNVKSGSNANSALTGVQYSGTQITGGRISATATTVDGKQADVNLYSASQYDKPSTPYSTVSASDGSQWYQTASGEGMGAFYQTPQFTGDASEASEVAAMFPSAAEGTSLRTVDDGILEATNADGGNSLWYNSAHFDEPDAPHENIQDANGTGWYAMQPHAETPEFDNGSATTEASDMQFDGNSANVAEFNAATAQTKTGAMPPNGVSFANVEPVSADVSANAPEYNLNIVNSEQSATLPQSGISEIPRHASYETQYNAESDNIGSTLTENAPAQVQSGIGEMPQTGTPSADYNYTSEASSQIGSLTGYTPAPLQSSINEMQHSASSYVDYDTSTTSGANASASEYNLAQFRQFMPGYEQQASQIDTSRSGEGVLEVRHADGSVTTFYDKTRYHTPRGDYQTYEDNRGGQWYAIPGTPAVERRPVFENGKSVYDGETLKTVNVESIRYKTTPAKFEKPKKRNPNDRKVPNPKRK